MYIFITFNAQRMRTRVTVGFYQSTDFLRLLYKKMNIPVDFTPISKGFKHRDSLRSFRLKVSFICFSVPSQRFS